MGRVLFERIERTDGQSAVPPAQLQMMLQIAQNSKCTGDAILRMLQAQQRGGGGVGSSGGGALSAPKHVEAVIVAHAWYVYKLSFQFLFVNLEVNNFNFNLCCYFSSLCF